MEMHTVEQESYLHFLLCNMMEQLIVELYSQFGLELP